MHSSGKADWVRHPWCEVVLCVQEDAACIHNYAALQDLRPCGALTKYPIYLQRPPHLLALRTMQRCASHRPSKGW